MRSVSSTREFFAQLNLLLENVPLVQSLTVLSQVQNAKHIRIIALSVLENIQKGYSFSRSVFLCPYLCISSGVASLLESGERGSCIEEIISYICEQDREKNKIMHEIINAIVYPLTIIISAIIGTMLLLYWKDLYLTSISTDSILFVVIKALCFLFILLFALGLYMYFSLKIPPVFQLYYSLSVLQKAGFTFSTSLELFMNTRQANSFHTKLHNAYVKISKGYSLSFSLREEKLANNTMGILLELAEKSGAITQACSEIARRILENYERKKQQCLQLMEPFLLFIVGVYLAILLDGIMMPYITDFGGLI